MSVIINNAPNEIDFCGNGLPFELEGDSFIITEGSKGNYFLNIVGATLVAGDWIDLWDYDSGAKFRITVAANPNAVLNEIPVNSEMQDILDSLVQLYLVNKFYSVFYYSRRLYFYPRIPRYIQWSTMAGFSTNFTLDTSTDGVDAEYLPDYSIFCSLAYFNSYISITIAEMTLHANQFGNCNIDIGNLLKQFTLFIKPALNSLVVSSFNLLRYEVLFGEKYPVNGIQTVTFMKVFRAFVLNGKLTNEENLGYNLITDITDNHIFLNLRNSIDIFQESMHFLSYYNPLTVAETIEIIAKIYYIDLTDQTETILSNSYVPDVVRIYSFPCSIDALGLNSFNPTKEIYKYEIWVNGIEYIPSAIAITIITGTNELLAESNLFTAGDVGKTIKIAGAGISSLDLIATITSFLSNVNVQISVNASSTVTNLPALSFGVDRLIAGPVTFNLIKKPMFVREFCFLNKFGVYEFFHAVTKSFTLLEVKKDIVQKADNSVDDLLDQAHNIIKCNTGSMTSADAIKMQYFLYSEDFCEIINLEYFKCIIEPETFQIIEESSNISNIEFSYRRANNL